MKELNKLFESNGFKFEQIKRAKNIALYKKYKIGNPRSFHYEVIRVLSHNGYTINNVNYPPSEYYPRSEDWGKNGFTYQKEKNATQRFNELLNAKD